MSDDTGRKPVGSGAKVLGLGAAACAACCAGPVLATLSAIGIASAAGYLAAGSVAIAVGIVVAIGVVARRRRRTTCAPPEVTERFVPAPTTGPARPPGDAAGEPRPGAPAPTTAPR
jgi:hypothetical protein